MQRLYHLLAAGAERLGRRIEIEAVPRLVLNLGEQNGLAPERRRARDPVALRQHTNDLAMRMLRNLPRERAPIGLGHPVLGLDELVRRQARLEGGELFRVLDMLDRRLGRSEEHTSELQSLMRNSYAVF